MADLNALLQSVAVARQQFVAAASGLTYAQSQFKPSPDTWSVVDNVKHMVWAEMGGINGMWKTPDGVKANRLRVYFLQRKGISFHAVAIIAKLSILFEQASHQQVIVCPNG
ncbi:DinB family protein [Chryseolinea lacunae]|uniref:DinB family protein n=1 Tax=Chryseolinea lacunae TaxID=2801331 RepID=A0ABS1KQI8_9BACT|nr:DinB family protein [Chryseolinea lacunae]MBL0741463.1 DinB family protein [Chryseolinea lacunae]